MTREISNNQLNGTIPSSIGYLTKLRLLYVLAHTRWKTCAHTSSPLSMGVLLQHRDLANNHLESPLPSFLQTKPAIDTLNLRNNLFVREICSQRGAKCQSLKARLTHTYMLADVPAPNLV